MSPTKGTQVVTARVETPLVELARKRARRHGMSMNAWLNWAITQGLRKHSKGG